MTREAIVLDKRAAELKHICGADADAPCPACAAGMSMEVDEQEAINDQPLHLLGLSCKVWKGWKVAYRMRAPEDEGSETIVAKIDRKKD